MLWINSVSCDLKQTLLFLLLFYNIDGLYDNQPKFIAENGNLVIESAENRNISFRMKGSGYVNVNDINILNLFKSTSNKLSQYQLNNQPQLIERIQDLESKLNDENGIIKRLTQLENGHEKNNNPNSNEIKQLHIIIQHLEDRFDKTIQKLTNDNCISFPCQNGGTCISRYEGFICLCPKSWEGVTCSIDINECEQFEGTDLGCQNGATCQNTQGSYNCLCKSGWKGLHCTRQTADCLSGNSEDLCGHGACVQSSNNVGYTCICDQGWKTNGVTPACTVDIDECLDSKPHCSKEPEVTCVNLPGSFMCGHCPPGFSGNGFYCTDINECDSNNGGCSKSPLVPCINSRGSFRCGRCPSGYSGDGNTCIRSGSSCTDQEFCHPQARCIQYENNVPLCECPPGYTGDGFGPNGCTITSGCTPNPCLNGGICVANETKWKCDCPPRTVGTNCATRIDRCHPNPCLNGGKCKQTLTGKRCSCRRGYIGVFCQIQQRICGGRLTSSSGTLQYPINDLVTYQTSTKCVWIINTNITQVLNVTFTQFSLGQSSICTSDWLQIHDGRSTANHLIGRFCGKELPKGGSIISTRNIIYLWLNSDNSTLHSGFSLNWTSIDPICGGEIESTTFGTISSPGSPGKYPQNRDCSWHIRSPPRKRIEMHFYAMNLEIHNSCDFDYLAIFDGSSDQGTLLEKYCNTSFPQPLFSNSNEITIQFHSDGYSSDTGFQLHYSIVEGIPGCGGTFTSLIGEFSSPMENGRYQHNLLCQYLIIMTVKMRIHIEFRDFHIEDHSGCSKDHVAIFEGKTDQDRLVNKYCGDKIPSSYTSESNILLIQFKSDFATSYSGFRIHYNNVCGETLTENGGTFNSPNYPESHILDLSCTYIIEAPVGSVILLNFIDFDIKSSKNCSIDYIEVFDGTKSDLSSIGKYCGDQIPERIISTNNYLHLELRTDISISGRGIKANYTFIDLKCGGVIKTTDTLIKPPSKIEGEYVDQSYCTWVIVAPPEKVIQLTWTSFDIEGSSSCNYDYVEIYDNSTSYGGLIGRFCGQNHPPTFTSTDNIITIIFKSDLSRSSGSFSGSIDFRDASNSCGGRFHSTTGVLHSPGFPKNYLHSKNCEWIISVPSGQQIELISKSFEIESHRECRYDYLEIRNGGTSNSPLLGKFCGDTIPERLTSFSNQMYFKFVSDNSLSAKGFEFEWDGTATGCGGTLTSHRGTITSPNYPDPYGENTICIWKINVNLGSNIQIIISDLEMESSGGCTLDYLEIFDGRDSSAHSFGRFCTNNHPLHIESTENNIYLRMQSYSSDQGRGFNLKYLSGCKRNITGYMGVIESPNFPGSYPEMVSCEWSFHPIQGNQILIEFSHFNIENSDEYNEECSKDYLEIIELENTTKIFSTKYCMQPPINFTSYNNVIVNFVTKESGSASRFRLEWRNVGCGGIMRGPNGKFTSPNYPKPYPENTHCEWTIITEEGQSIELTINDYSFVTTDNCKSDGLMISNGQNISHILANLCNTKTEPTVIIGGGNQMFVKFYNDFSMAGKGFSAEYRSIESKCGSILTLPKGFIYSPHYPRNYEDNNICEWLIRVEKDHLIELHIMEFDIENSTDCRNDNLMIYDGAEKNNAKVLLKYCGNKLPNITKYVTSHNEMLITFNSNDAIAAQGFKLNYSMACGARIIANETGIITLSESFKSYLTDCIWIIESSKPSQHITLTITHLDLFINENVPDTMDRLEIYDGDNLNSPKKEVLFGIKHPTPIISSGQFLTLHLVSKFSRDSILSQLHFTAFYSIFDNACGGTFTSEQGKFSSPHYPKSYPLNVECIWRIEAAPGNEIGINWNSLDITESDNCYDSYLEIRENDGGGKLLGVYCGQTIPTNLMHSNVLWIKFRSGELKPANGFIAEYFYRTQNELNGLSGLIASPLYPHYLLPRDETYTWRVTTIFRSLIIVTFKEFANTNPFCNDELKIYDGYDETAPTLAENFCGIDTPEPVTSSSNVIFFELQQSKSFMGSRFLINWETVEADSIQFKNSENKTICGNRTIILNKLGDTINFTSPGYPYGYEPNINCSWIIMSSSPNNHPVIELQDIDLEEVDDCKVDFIEIFESDDLSTWKKLTHRCSYSKSTENTFHGGPYLRIDFQTDVSINKTGFRGLLKLKCGSTLKQSLGIISLNTSEYVNIGRSMKNNECLWNINVRPGRTIKFTFEKLQLPFNQDRCSSYIILRNGIDEESPFLGIGKYCGSKIIEINETSSNKALVKFKYNYDRDSNFVLRYQEVSQECGGNFILNKNVNSTIITSPNYPNVPFAHSECIWTIMAPSGETLKFDFIDTFDLRESPGCKDEYVEIRDGGTYGSQIIGRYCESKPLPDTTSNNVMQIKFFTDVAEPNNGFKIKVSIALCGSVYRSHTGIIMSPNYPNSYPSNLNCEYHIFGKLGTFLTLTFLNIDLPHGNCKDSDKIEIYSIVKDENLNVTEISLGSFCGTNIPQPIIANGNEVKLRFKTFQNQNKQGFKISYNSSAQGCDFTEFTAETGVITSPGYPNAKLMRHYCIYTIRVPKGRRIRIDFDDFDLNLLSQHIEFYNSFKENNRIAYFKGGDHVSPIYSSDNIMEINLWIRFSSNNRGFKLRYSSNESTICEGDLNNQDGLIIGPSNITNYACEYARNPTPFFEQVNIGTLAMDFTDMIIGNSSNTFCNYVTTRISVWFGGSPDPSNTLAMLCSNTNKSAKILSPFVDTKVYAIQGLKHGNLSFNLAYKVHKCGGLIYSQSEVSISKPNFTENYGKVDCAWQIKFDEGLVNITFRTIKLKLSCDKEYINIYNGPTPKSPKMGKFCQTSLPFVLTSHSHVLFVEYHADSYSSESVFDFNLSPFSAPCGGILTNPHFSFKSPTVNSKYPNNIECIWEIQSFVGYNIGLQFTGRFFIEQSNNCTKDYIEIFEKTNDEWSSFGRVCGRETPRIFNSTGTHMKVLFRSDDAIAGEGFNATWNENCGGTFNATTDIQLISSPGYPEPYGKSMICNYTINASNDKFINLKFLDFEIENNLKHCMSDNVTIYKRLYYYPYDVELQGIYCRNKPKDLRAKGPISIVFMTDDYVERKGFQFEFVLDTCGGDISKTSVINSPKRSEIEEYPSELICNWNITAPAGKKISIRFEKLITKYNERCYYDYVEIYSGKEILEEHRLAKLCGNLTLNPPTINIDSNHSVLHLHTDTSYDYGEFSALILFSEMCDKIIELSEESPALTLNEIHSAYPPLLDCHFLVKAPPNRLIKISFEQFHLATCDSPHNKSECTCDFIEIRDGAGPFSDLIGKYCGHTIPRSVASSGPALWIRFSTDATINSTGFAAKLSLHDFECGSRLINISNNSTTIIQSPGDDNYLPNLRCIWKLVSESGENIEIDFEKFNLQTVGDYGECSNDILEIYEDDIKLFSSESIGKELIYSSKLGSEFAASFYSGIRSSLSHNQYCGNVKPQPYISSTNKVYVKFQTDSNIELTGFKLVARVIQNCGRNYTSTQGRIVVNNAESCEFWITAPKNYTISLFFISFSFDQEENCIMNAFKIYENSPNGKLINSLCGYSVPNPVFATTNSIYIRILKEANKYESYDFNFLATDQGLGCGGQLFNYGGIFSSPLYPLNDRNFSDCIWNITVPQNLRVALKFTEFNIGTEKTCETNFVEIIEIADHTELKNVVRKYCGSDLPATYRGKRNVLSVRFKKTVNFAGTGFMAHYIGFPPDATINEY